MNECYRLLTYFTLLPECIVWPARGHPINFSMWSGDIQCSNLFCLAEILLNFNGAKISLLPSVNWLLILLDALTNLRSYLVFKFFIFRKW